MLQCNEKRVKGRIAMLSLSKKGNSVMWSPTHERQCIWWNMSCKGDTHAVTLSGRRAWSETVSRQQLMKTAVWGPEITARCCNTRWGFLPRAWACAYVYLCACIMLIVCCFCCCKYVQASKPIFGILALLAASIAAHCELMPLVNCWCSGRCVVIGHLSTAKVLILLQIQYIHIYIHLYMYSIVYGLYTTTTFDFSFFRCD